MILDIIFSLPSAVYFILELIMTTSTKMMFIHKLLILPRIWWQLRKMTPTHWVVKKFWSSYPIMNRLSRFRYEFYVEFNSLVETGNKTAPILTNPKFTNDWVEVNFWGKIVRQDFQSLISSKDELFKDEVKQFKRDQHLKKLGL